MSQAVMAEIATCEECGTVLPLNAPQGLCPRCLLGMAIRLNPRATPSAPQPVPRASPPKPGAVRSFGDYELLAEIARGGMGIVYKARQISLNRIVAVKVLLFGRFSSDEFVRRFKAEAEVLAGLQHANIVAIHEVGEHEGQPFFSMDFVEGRNLADLARDSPLPPGLAADYLKTIARAIHYAHQHGILHRDLKPANVLIDTLDRPRVTDFGLAKRLETGSDLSLTGQMMGTPSFSSPEQVAGRRALVGPASDVYSLGAILYYLLTGRAPFLAESLQEAFGYVLNAEPVPPRLLYPKVPQDLEIICLKCMHKEPHARYPSAAALADDLERWIAGKPILARPAGPLEHAWRWCHRNRAVSALAAVALLSLLAISVGSPIALYRIQREDRRAHERLNQLRVQRADELFDEDDASAALASLARVLRDDPANQVAATRIHSALTYRSFALPLLQPLSPGARLTCARLSPDAKYVLMTTAVGTARVWDSQTGAPVRSQFGHNGAISSARFSPDGRTVVTTSEDGTARLWEAATGRPLAPPLQHTEPVTFAQFSPNGQQVVTCSMDKTARVWDARTGSHITGSLLHAEAVNYAEFSPDGARLVTASMDKTARIWALPTGRPVGPPLVHEGWVASACFSPDGRWIVTASRDGFARLWDAQTGEPRMIPPLKLDGSGDWAEFDPGGEDVVTVSVIATAQVWDTTTGTPIAPPLKHNGRVSSAHFSPEGQRVLTASFDHTARLWDALTGRALSERLKHEAGVYSADFSWHGLRVLTASADAKACVWDVHAGQALLQPLRHEGPVSVAQFSPDGSKILTASRDGTARLWDARSGQPLPGSLHHGGRVQFASFSPDGTRVVTASQDWTARIWSTQTGQALGDPLPHGGSVECARFSPDGRWVLTASADRSARVWNASNSWPVTPPLRHTDQVIDAQFSPDGRHAVTASRDGTAKIWDLQTGRPLPGPLVHANWVVSACFSPDGLRVLTASDDGTARLWDARSGLPAAEPMRHDASVDLATFSPDGRFVVTASADRTACIWDARTGRLVAEPLRHSDRVTCAQFSPDGARVVTASRDNTARVWDARTGQPLSEPLRHEGIVNYAQFSPDGQWVVTASLDDTARLWEVPLAPLPVPSWFAELAEDVAGQCLTPEGASRAVSCARILRLKLAIQKARPTDFYTQWAQWFFADRAVRTTSPNSSMAVQEYIKNRIDENTIDSLREAVLLSPTNGLALARLARSVLDQAQVPESRRRTQADWLSRRAVALAPADPEVIETRQRVAAATNTQANIRKP